MGSRIKNHKLQILFLIDDMSGKSLFEAVANCLREVMNVVTVFTMEIFKATGVSDRKQLLFKPCTVFAHHQVHLYHQALVEGQRTVHRFRDPL